MTPNDRRRLITIAAVLLLFLIPLMYYGPLSGEQAMIPLGLDLSGGVDVQITVDIDDTARKELGNLKFRINGDFRRAVIGARLDITDEGEQPGLEILLREPETDAASALQQLQPYVDQGILEEVDATALASSRGTVLILAPEYLSGKIDQAVNSAADIVKQRVDSLGVAQSDVRVEGRSRIRVQLPGEQDSERVIRNLIRPANLEFRLVYPSDQRQTMEGTLARLINEDGTTRPGSVIPDGYELLQGEPDADLDVQATQFIGVDPETGEEVAWYLVRDEASVWGEHLRSIAARPGGQFGNEMVVTFELTTRGTRRFAEVTEENVGQRLAIVLEDNVRSAPNIREAILHGRGEISGNFTLEEARDLENILRAGALPAKLIPGEQSYVGPSLGEDSIRSGVRASLLGVALVMVFMIIYYNAAGGLAIVALVNNVVLVLGGLSLLRATLTLPGIAGIILTIGMAVDANVLIFERIREELRAGKSLRNAITHGFGRAFSAIFDANITTLITALVLLQFGFGPVRGFALTMTFGIFATLFTGLFVTQVLMSLYFNIRQRLPLGKLNILDNPDWNFMGVRHVAYGVSALLVIAAIADIGLINRGFNLGVDFSGGVQVEVAMDQTHDRGEIEGALLDGGFEAPRVQTLTRSVVADDTGEGDGVAAVANFLVRIPQSEVIETEDSALQLTETEDAVIAAIGADLGDTRVWASQSRSVSAETGARLQKIAIWIVILASIGIFIYVAIRFDRVFSIAALAALFHDLFITLGVITLLDVSLSLEVVAALLTIMGYSLNDTIVVFDRIRENRGLMEGREFGSVVNSSINQMLSRTLITSGTTLVAVLSLLIFGGPGVSAFALTLVVGFIIGTYSSIFIASPIVYTYMRRIQSTPAKSR